MAALGLSIDGRLEEGETLRAWGLGTEVDSWNFQALVNGSWVNVGVSGANTYVIPAGAAGTAYRLVATSEGVTSYSPVTGAAIVDTRKINAPYLTGPAGQVIGTEDPGARSVFSWLTFSDPDKANYGGGSLLLQDSASLLYGGDGHDMLSVRFGGTGAGQFSYNAATREVRYAFINGNPVAIGTIDAALNGNGTDLKIAFNANATVAVVDALINNLQFSNADDSPTFSRLLTLRVTDPTGASAQRVTAAYIENTADAPVFTSATSFAVNENQATVGTVAALDPDKEAGQPQGITYSLVTGEGSLNNGAFQIDAATGVLSFRAAPDFESPYLWPEYSVRVRATDSEGSISEQALVVTVRNVNEAPVASSIQVQAQEDGPAITFDAVFSDPDAGDSHTITLTGAPVGVTLNGRTFTYDSAGRFEYLPGPDHGDVAPGYDSFTYTVTDAAGLSSTQTVSVRVQGQNDPASITGSATAGVQEDTGLNFAESLVASGQLVVSDPDRDEGAVRATLTGSSGPGYFSVYPSGQWSWFVSNSQVQYLGAGETAVASALVTSYDGTATRELRVTVAGVNDTPRLVNAPGSNLGDVTEAGASGAGVAQAAGRIHAVDSDASDSLTFSGNANGLYGSFAIDSTTGQWTYALDNSLPWTQSLAQGQTAVETFTATARDPSGASVQQQVTITVHGANDAPVIASASNLSGVVQEPTVGTGMLVLDLGAQYGQDNTIVDAAGRVVVLGQGQDPNGFSAPVIARLNPDGSPDTTFGDGGQVAVTPYFKPASVAVDAAGRYLTAGYTSANYMYTQLDWAVERRHPDGSLDTSFGNGGLATFDFGGYDRANSVEVDAAGGILVFGYLPDAGTGTSGPGVLRLDASGAPDWAFGNNGRLVFGDALGPLVRDAQGRFLSAGYTLDAQTGDPQFQVQRFLPDGSVDTSFREGGVAGVNLQSESIQITQWAVGSDGQVLLGWTEFAGDWSYLPFSLALLQPDGSLDLGFGGTGVVQTTLNAKTLELAFDAQGRPLAGFSGPVAEDFQLARFNLDGTLDPSFHLGGTTAADLGGEETVESIEFLQSGAVLVVGTSWQDSNLGIAFASFDEQGNLNTQFGEPPTTGALMATGTVYVTGFGWDNGDTAQWTGSATGLYGEFQLTPQGSWTYVLDVNDPDTQALEDGTTGTEHFTCTVTDSFGATASCEVAVTVVGSYDPPAP